MKTVFTTKQFWKATAVNTLLIAALLMTTILFLMSVKYTTEKLEKTELAMLQITTPAELFEHSEEIIQAQPTAKRMLFLI